MDVGAHHGLWCEAVLDTFDVELHAFEASKDAFGILSEKLADRVTINWNAVSNRNDDLVFHVYRDDARLSSLHRRLSVEDELLGSGYDEIRVPGTTLDSYWHGRREQIRLLKVDVEGAEYDALRGARRLLKAAQVDFVQFEYGGTFFDAGTTLRNVWSYLRRCGYRVLRQKDQKFTELKTFGKGQEDYKYSNYVAVHERIFERFMKKNAEISLYLDRLAHFGIKPHGVLHVGAHLGDEIETYRANDMSPVAFVEANPDLAGRLRQRFKDDADVTVIEAAASQTEGSATFNITSMDQSSSLLDLKEHAKLYPKIGVAKQVEVRTAPLDRLVEEAGVDMSGIDFIAMDIQGAELMALKGATGILEGIRAIQLEVNFEELYEGCALIGDLDDFLGRFDFVRVKTATPYSETWGDALYVKRPLVTCSAVGNMGRFANEVFQYLFVQTYAAEHDYVALNPVWTGDKIFNVKPGVDTLPDMPFSKEQTHFDLATCDIANDPDVRPATDFKGYFQYETRYYQPYKDLIREHLSFKGAYADYAAEIRDIFEARPGPVVGLHLRRGDYGTGVFFLAPDEWYLDWLSDMTRLHPDLTVYIASDDLGSVLSAFEGFDVLTSRDLPPAPPEHEFFADFAALCTAEHLAISNSSFSFIASMLNCGADTFVRPCLTEKKLIPYEPWNAPVLLRAHTAEEAGEDYMSARAKTRSKYKWRKLRKSMLGV